MRKLFLKTRSGCVGYINKDGWFHSNSFISSLDVSYVIATDEEVRRFHEEKKRIRYQRTIRTRRENKILKLIGLTRQDFCRFRNIYDHGDWVQVTTRENGMNMFSQDAVQKVGSRLITRETDEFDSTYCHYSIKKC